MATKPLTAKEAEDRAKELATPLNDLIKPDYINSEIDSWQELDKEEVKIEVYESISIIMGELNYSHQSLREVTYQRAIKHHIESMQRVPFEHITMNTRKEANKYGYWCYDQNYTNIRENIYDIFPTLEDLPTEDYQAAYEDVSNGLYNGMIPDCLQD